MHHRLSRRARAWCTRRRELMGVRGKKKDTCSRTRLVSNRLIGCFATLHFFWLTLHTDFLDEKWNAGLLVCLWWRGSHTDDDDDEAQGAARQHGSGRGGGRGQGGGAIVRELRSPQGRRLLPACHMYCTLRAGMCVFGGIHTLTQDDQALLEESLALSNHTNLAISIAQYWL